MHLSESLESSLNSSHRLRTVPQIPLNDLRRRVARAQDDERNEKRQKRRDRSQDDDDFHALIQVEVHQQGDGQDFEEEGRDEGCVCVVLAMLLEWDRTGSGRGDTYKAASSAKCWILSEYSSSPPCTESTHTPSRTSPGTWRGRTAASRPRRRFSSR